MNLSEKMNQLIIDLPIKFKNVDMENLKPELQEQWSEDYAIGNGLYFKPVWDNEYFDYGLLKNEILSYIVAYFGPNSSLTTSDPNNLDDDHVVVRFNEHCGEIEVYKAKYARRNK